MHSFTAAGLWQMPISFTNVKVTKRGNATLTDVLLWDGWKTGTGEIYCEQQKVPGINDKISILMSARMRQWCEQWDAVWKDEWYNGTKSFFVQAKHRKKNGCGISDKQHSPRRSCFCIGGSCCIKMEVFSFTRRFSCRYIRPDDPLARPYPCCLCWRIHRKIPDCPIRRRYSS